jgi:hypothetical protein
MFPRSSRAKRCELSARSSVIRSLFMFMTFPNVFQSGLRHLLNPDEQHL